MRKKIYTICFANKFPSNLEIIFCLFLQLTHSFNRYFLRIYYESGTKQRKISALVNVTFYREES